MQTTALIVGAGPVGLTAAIELARYGVSVRIVERRPEPSEESRALAIWARTLELMDRAGVGAALVAAGLKASGTRMFSGNRQIGEVGFDHLASAHRYVLLIPQNVTERVLTEHLFSLGVSVERAVELSSFDDNDDGISATLRHPDGSVETLEAVWLVACDGAHSPIRHMLNKSFDGTSVTTDFILADVYVAGGADVSRSQISMFAHVDGLLLMFPIGGDRYRVIADLGDATGLRRPDATLETVQAIVDERGPGGITAHDPLWLSTFRINERQVVDYRSGHVFLAGDAAHVHSPAGGQGMNTGMQDACNLAWKLALVCEGTCSSEVLDTYNAERRPVAHEMIAETSKLTAVMTVKTPVLQSLRNRAMSLLLGIPSVNHALAERLSEITIGYPDSALARNSATWNASPRAGGRAPQITGETSDGAGGPRYTLYAEDDERARRFVEEHDALVAPNIRPPFAPRAMWLVRPDGYVGIVADAGDHEALRNYLAIVVGRFAKTT